MGIIFYGIKSKMYLNSKFAKRSFMTARTYRLILLIALLLLWRHGFAQNTSEIIHWQTDYKLKWEDFQGAPDSSSPNIAVCGCSIRYYYYEENGGFKFNTFAYFDKKKSWANKSVVDSASLIHEQGHFDICEMYARKLSLKFDSLQTYESSIKTLIEDIAEIITVQTNEAQTQYDIETLYGSDLYKQREWCIKIREMLTKK